MQTDVLMIGDLVRSKKHNKVIKVHSIRPGYITFKENGRSISVKSKDIEPIVPTDELMVLNGFCQNGIIKHWYSKYFGNQRVSVYLHNWNGIFWSYDYWVERPFGDNNSQTKFGQVWFEIPNEFSIVKKQKIHLSAGEVDGIHLLQHAMKQADIDYNWDLES